MIINKEIISKLYKEYFFITGVFDIDAQYFKKRIDEGVKNSKLNYKTSVRGRQTDWKFFNQDRNFGLFLLKLNDYLSELHVELRKYHLFDAWGLIEKFGEFTVKHSHDPAYLSGVLYINDHHQKLYFPDIKQEVTPQKGRFVLFSPFLTHHTKRNYQELAKYAISFNFVVETVGETI